MSDVAGRSRLSDHVREWMSQLAQTRPIFHNEIDFQLALALVMMSHGVERVRLERRIRLSELPMRGKAHLEVHIMGVLGGNRIALELKYPKRRFTGTVISEDEPEDFDLPAGGAPDVDSAAIWHDAERIERLLDEGTVVSGATLALSNYPFWSDATLRLGTKAYAFRL